MRKIFLILAASLCLVACSKEQQLMLIPQPQSVTLSRGHCRSSATVTESVSNDLGAEQYILTIDKNAISITGGSDAGVFYGNVTLAQLRRQYGDKIPCMRISDSPRFEYRGMHLDVSRHFFNAEFIKKQLRAMASLKLNHFHWHLTDGVAWRMPIDSHPDMVAEDHYTKEEIREVIALAESLHITVIPEIEMFGHSEEVVAAYPELGCRHGGDEVLHQLCIGNEKTFEFLEDVLEEVIELFPSKLIHVGGDEANYDIWAKCSTCQARIAKEHLSGPEELQTYGFKRIAAFLSSRGRTMIGWDETLDGGLAEGAVVMSWRGTSGALKAAELGHRAILTPQSHCYLDAFQDAPYKEPVAFGNIVPLDSVYCFDPAPESMPSREMVLGVQTNLWTEMIQEESHVEYMLYPRVFALSEVAWTEPHLMEFSGFRNRALQFCDYFREDGYNTFDLRTEVGDRPESKLFSGHLALDKPYQYNTMYENSYPGTGEQSLTDGKFGAWGYRDGWQGFLNKDVVITIDLGKSTEIHMVGGDFCQWRTAWICMPVEVYAEVSEDGENFTEVGRLVTGADLEDERPLYETYSVEIPDGVKARYVRFTGQINEDKWGWLFTDEVVVK